MRFDICPFPLVKRKKKDGRGLPKDTLWVLFLIEAILDFCMAEDMEEFCSLKDSHA